MITLRKTKKLSYFKENIIHSTIKELCREYKKKKVLKYVFLEFCYKYMYYSRTLRMIECTLHTGTNELCFYVT